MGEASELVQFLDPTDNRAVAAQALEIVEGLSGSSEGLAVLRPETVKLHKNLFRCVKDASLSRSALTCVVNITQDETICQALVAGGACTQLLDYAHEGVTAHTDLLVMALSNLTQSEAGAAAALQSGQGELECSRMRRFFAVALRPSSSSSLYEHAPGIACNCTRLRSGRTLLMEGTAGAGLSALVDTLQDTAAVRRMGAAAAIKNIVLAAPQDGTLDKVLQDTERLRRLLVRMRACALTPARPLAFMHCSHMFQGAQARCRRVHLQDISSMVAYVQAPINGKVPKEVEDQVREDLATTAAIICRGEAGRKALMAADGHDSLKKGYELEEHAGTMAAMEEAARALMGVQLDDALAQDGPEGLVLTGQ